MNTELAQRLHNSFSELFANEPQLMSRLKQCAVVKRLRAGQRICHEGDTCGFLPLLLEGRARVYKMAESGREITLYRIEPGESCVLTASCIMSEIPFPALAVTECEVEALLVPASTVREWLSESPSWRHYIFKLVAHRLTDVITVIQEVAFRRMDARIAAQLLGRGDVDGIARTTHQELAVELGSSREVVSRILRDMENEGMIRRQRGEIVLLAPNALRSIASL